MKIKHGSLKSLNNNLFFTFFKVFLIGWIVYFALFFITDHPGAIEAYGSGPSDRFRDFFEVNKEAAAGDSYLTGRCANYPPLALLIAKFFALFTPSTLTDASPLITRDTASGMILFVIVFSSLYILTAYCFYDYFVKNLKGAGKNKIIVLFLTVMLCTSYSLIFAVKRGNYIFIALVAFVFFVFTYRDHKIISAVALAICACLKVYPVLFFLIFLLDKRFKAFFIGMATGIIGLFLPMLAFKGSVIQQFQGFMNGVLNFSSTSQATKGEVLFNHLEQHSNSFSNIFRAIPVAIFGIGDLSGYQEKITHSLSIISTVMLVLLVLISIVSIIVVKQYWKRLFIVFAMICLIPSNTYDYMLIFAIPILVILLCEGEFKKDRPYVILITMLTCVSKAYYYFSDYGIDVSIQCVINPMIMTVIVVMIFCDSTIPAIYQYIANRKTSA